MIYDFDTPVERRGTGSLKWDFAVERGKPEGLLPLWVADMDFPAPPCVTDELRRMADHGIFSYAEAKPDYYEAAAGWFRRRFGWEPQETWLVKTPGVVFALAMAVKALTAPGDAVLIQTPVYYPFHEIIRDNGRRLVSSELLLRNGRYEIDFEDFERVVAENGVKLFLLCSPHNPMGRVWTAEELRRMADICRRHGVYIASDEIHCDFAFPEHPHTLLPQAAPDFLDHILLCTAPSKTFNLAGLQISNIWIPDKGVRTRFRKAIDGCGYSQLNAAGLRACKAAYLGGEDWFEQCRVYLRGNLDFFRDFLRTRLPELSLIEPDGTYFAWVDCSGLGLSQDALNDLIVRKAGLWLDAGHIFGENSGQYQRFVLATSRATVAEALRRLEAAVQSLRR